MMKKTQWKDALRNIKGQIVSYVSILVIALLGVASFLSICYASRAMNANGTEQYREMNFRNIEIISTLMLTAEDVEAIRGIEGVADVEPVWQTNAEVYVGELQESVTFITLNERINRPQVLEGRLPENTQECAVESRLAEKMGWHVGDQVGEVTFTDITGQYYIGEYSLEITGIIVHPEHLSLTLPETMYILVSRDCYDMEAIEGCCIKAEVTVSEATQANLFSEEHREEILTVRRRIEALAPERTVLRDAAVKAEAYQTIEEYEEAYRANLARLQETKRELEGRRQALEADLRAFAEAEARLNRLTPGTAEYADEAAKLDSVRKELEERQAALEDEESENEEYIAITEENLSDLGDTRTEVEEMAPCQWIVLDERGNASFVQLLTGSENLGSLQMTFALLFLVISALVIYATVSKMVDEQRTLVGTAKAMGFFNREILAKYLFFGVSSTLVGMVCGIVLARFLMEGIALRGYNDYFAIDISKPHFDLVATLIVLLSGILLSTCAVVAACLRLVRQSANSLMQPPVPKGKSKAAKNGRHALTLYGRLILRNIRTDWKRVLVTVVSVAGCCALIVIGFSLKNAVSGCVKKQYSEIVDYDSEIKFDYAYMKDEIEPMLIDAGAEYITLYNANIITRIEDTDIAELMCGDLAEIGRMYHLLDWKTGEPIVPADDGIFIQRRLAEIYGLDVGSEFEIAVNLTQNATVRVAGVFENYIGLPVAMSSAYYEALYGEPCEENTFFVRLNGADEAALLAQLEEVWISSYLPSDTDRSTFEASTGIINSVVALFIVMAAIMAGVVVMNLTNIQVLQKKREMTVMRVNGFTTREVIGYLLRETAVTTILGILLGIGAGAGMSYGIVRSLEQSFVQFDRGVCIAAWGCGAAITLLFTVLINCIALRNVKNLKLTDAD